MENLEVDKRYLHTVRREIEANAVKIYAAFVRSGRVVTPADRVVAIQYAIEDVIALRNGVDGVVVAKTPTVNPSYNTSPTTATCGDLTDGLAGHNVDMTSSDDD
jgi:hypothetical protein